MHDTKYCYANSDVLKNKLNITDSKELFETEKELTSIRLHELQESPIKGKYDFNHLKAIHKYIFQDIYTWAGQVRTVEIGKGNLFCTTPCIPDYANSVFKKYFSQCYAAKDNFGEFVKVFADNYGDLNALHPFREGNGRAQREFARLVCLECGYDFDLSNATHKEMLEASVLSFERADSSLFIKIFSNAITPHDSNREQNIATLCILTSDDLTINPVGSYDYYEYNEHGGAEIYDAMYKAKINKMDAEKAISDAKASLNSHREKIKQFDSDKIISAFKETNNIPEQTELRIEKGYIVVDVLLTKDNGELMYDADGKEIEYPLQLFEINKDDPFNMETGLNVKNMNLLRDSLEQMMPDIGEQNIETYDFDPADDWDDR